MIMIMLHFLSVLTWTLSARAYYPYYVLSVWAPRAGIIVLLGFKIKYMILGKSRC